jgi:Spy/CpxP family protein refolding chaperone
MRSNTVTRVRLGLFAGAIALAGFAPSFVPAQDAAPATGDAKPAAAQDAEQAQARERRRRQGGGQGGVRPEEVIKELDLTDEQKTKVEAILAESRTAQQEARTLQGEERRQKMQEVQRSQREKLNAVLNAEQQQKFQQAMAKAQATQGMQRVRSAVSQLGLSQEQQTKVDAIFADADKKVREASAQPQEAGAGGRGRGGPYRAVMQETRQKINEVLTDDQKTKFAELAPEGGRGQGQGQGGNRRRNNQQQ